MGIVLQSERIKQQKWKLDFIEEACRDSIAIRQNQMANMAAGLNSSSQDREQTAVIIKQYRQYPGHSYAQERTTASILVIH